MKILIAEDDAVSRKLLESNLHRWGHEAVSCKDGDQAWAYLEQPDTPRLAILDWMMPGIEGPELCRRARELRHGSLLYLILLTAKGDEADLVQGLQAGADDYVTKPFSREEMRARMGVGLRFLELQERLIEAERNRVVVQAAGAAAHEINQPLTVLMGTAQLLQMRAEKGAEPNPAITEMYNAAERIREIVQQMGKVRTYATRPYIEGIDIVDFGVGSDEPETE
jgi:DNA-binding response OmpR family regulator